ncbi:MAG TPA: GerMN domain-containing protein [Thermoanaerobaculia bacterium]|nr:GerMN domain-containing protein [Thermoanaerobaculia bacterium]
MKTSLSPGPSRSGIADSRRRERRFRWLWLPLLVAISCGAGDSETGLQSRSVTQRAPVFLIAMEDGGVDGVRVGCGDSAVPVEVSLRRQGPALEGALDALLAMNETYDTRTGFYNALHGSNLEVARVERTGTEVRVHLKGYLEIGGECDSPRVLAQLRETAQQFTDVERARFFLEGESLDRLLSGRGE